jgi:hypothetical protein
MIGEILAGLTERQTRLGIPGRQRVEEEEGVYFSDELY